jgi:hypothetical protein
MKDHNVFGLALSNARDVTSSFAIDLGVKEALEAIPKHDDGVYRMIRKVIDGCRLLPDDDWMGREWFSLRLEEWSKPEGGKARELLLGGEIAGVDGTNTIEQIDERGLTLFGCAVAWLTRKTRCSPQIKITQTLTPSDIDAGRIKTIDDLNQLLKESDLLREDHSWPTTFREYQERLCGLESGYHVLVDGPLMTQNLVSQQEGRKLLDRIIARDDRIFVGVIKSIDASSNITKTIAHCLHPGEGFVLGNLGRMLWERYAESAAVQGWADRLGDQYVRCVYRPNMKTFAFECRRREIPLVVAILIQDQSQTIGHELPSLIEYVDMYLRSQFGASSRIREIVLSRIHADDPIRSFDLIDERSFR